MVIILLYPLDEGPFGVSGQAKCHIILLQMSTSSLINSWVRIKRLPTVRRGIKGCARVGRVQRRAAPPASMSPGFEPLGCTDGQIAKYGNSLLTNNT